ncbi:MAG: hypothetical protein ACR2JZ_00240 [Candidatus Limnocylindrales bacterium]
MPLDFLKRKNAAEPPPAPVVPEEIAAQDFGLRLYYQAKSSEGVRMEAGPNALSELPNMLTGVAQTEVEVIEPLGMDVQDAAPWIQRPDEASRWLQAHHEHSPIARHGLVVLEAVDAIDLAFDTVVLALLAGDVDTSGYPEYNAIVGGVASHWDEATGDMIGRSGGAWGGRGVKGDTDRTAQKLLASLLANVLASRYAVGLTPIDRPVPQAGRGGLVCPHCGFASAHQRAFYCPKCGMRLLRG